MHWNFKLPGDIFIWIMGKQYYDKSDTDRDYLIFLHKRRNKSHPSYFIKAVISWINITIVALKELISISMKCSRYVLRCCCRFIYRHRQHFTKTKILAQCLLFIYFFCHGVVLSLLPVGHLIFMLSAREFQQLEKTQPAIRTVKHENSLTEQDCDKFI